MHTAFEHKLNNVRPTKVSRLSVTANFCEEAESALTSSSDTASNMEPPSPAKIREYIRQLIAQDSARGFLNASLRDSNGSYRVEDTNMFAMESC